MWKKIYDKILLIFGILTAVTMIHMIWVRVAARGYSLLTMNTGIGHHIAAQYNSCVVLFVIFAVIFAVMLCVHIVKLRPKR